MSPSRIALAACIGLAFTLPAFAPATAEETGGGPQPEFRKAPKAKERQAARQPAERTTPAKKPDGGKIIFF